MDQVTPLLYYKVMLLLLPFSALLIKPQSQFNFCYVVVKILKDIQILSSGGY